MQPYRRQPIRLLCPWDSPGKDTGVGCHFLLQCMKVKSESEVAQSCPTLSDPMDHSLPGFSIHGIFQARVLEWGATAFTNWGFSPFILLLLPLILYYLAGRLAVLLKSDISPPLQITALIGLILYFASFCPRLLALDKAHCKTWFSSLLLWAPCLGSGFILKHHVLSCKWSRHI